MAQSQKNQCDFSKPQASPRKCLTLLGITSKPMPDSKILKMLCMQAQCPKLVAGIEVLRCGHKSAYSLMQALIVFNTWIQVKYQSVANLS